MIDELWEHVPGGKPTERELRIGTAAQDAIEEAARALAKHGPANTMDAPSKTDGDRLAILVEEIGEVAKELTYDHAGIIIESIPEHRGVTAEMKSESYGIGESLTLLLPEGSSRWIDIAEMTDGHLAHYGYRRTTRQARLRKELIQSAAMALTWAAML